MLTVGEHLADQLFVPFALAGSGVLGHCARDRSDATRNPSARSSLP
jgi:RNA 3'-terminal phosphate cyclase